MKYLRVKNWSNYQHYKDRNPPWIKLHQEILVSRTWVALSNDSRVLALVIMLLASRHNNEIPYDLEYIRRVGYLEKQPDLQPLIQVDFLEVIKNQGDTDTQQADDSTPQADDSKVLKNGVPEGRGERGETETEKEKEKTSPSVPFDDIQSLWNDTMQDTDIPQIRGLNETRRKHLRARWEEDIAHQALEFWEEYFVRIRGTPFLTGKNERGWVVDFDFAIAKSKFLKILEGSYEGSQRSNGAGYHGIEEEAGKYDDF